MLENQSLTTKLYSQKAITIATFFGGPLAAGFLARQNFINLGKGDYGRNSMYIGIISTILLFVGIFSIPENIINKIPNYIIPAIYTPIIYYLIEKYQGKELKEHKDNNGEFYSGWKATGIGAACMAVIIVFILTYTFFSPVDFDATRYDNGMAAFGQNEEKALKLYTLIETSSLQESVEFIDNTGIPAWKSNLSILDDLDKIEGLYDNFIEQNKILRNYCNLRIESYQLMRSALIEDTDAYDGEIESKVKEIELELDKLEK